MNEPLRYALKILGIKDYFTAEIKEKLEARFSKNEAEETILKLDEYGYLNDEQTARNYISYKLRSGYGAYYIKEKLYRRGYEISKESVKMLAETEEIDLEAQIKKLAEKYKGKTGDPQKNYMRCISFLARRGFPTELCFKILKKGDFEK